jgi:urease accessory protein
VPLLVAGLRRTATTTWPTITPFGTRTRTRTITRWIMTTLLPDQALARRTRLVVEAEPGRRPRVRTETHGDPARPALRPMLAGSGPDRARVCLVPDGALLLAGDAVALDVQVGPGVRLDLVEPGGTVAYDMSGASARWDVRIDVAAGATLTWAGEPFVLAAGASVERSTSVRLGGGARLVLRETLVLGRHQERRGTIVQRWHATGPDDEELLVEDLYLDDTAHRPGILGAERVLTTVVALGLDVPDGLAAVGRLDLDGGGTVWRRLAGEAHLAIPQEAWDAALAQC